MSTPKPTTTAAIANLKSKLPAANDIRSCQGHTSPCRHLLLEQMFGAVGLLGQAVCLGPTLHIGVTQLLGVHAVPPGNRSVSRF